MASPGVAMPMERTMVASIQLKISIPKLGHKINGFDYKQHTVMVIGKITLGYCYIYIYITHAFPVINWLHISCCIFYNVIKVTN